MKKAQVTQKSETTNPPKTAGSNRGSTINVVKPNQDSIKGGQSQQSNTKNNENPNNNNNEKQQLINTLVKEQVDAIKPQEIEYSMSQLLGKFMQLNCVEHKTRQYDHICVNKKCRYPSIISCSKCILQDEQHSLNCKNDFNSLEKYLPIKIDQLSGKLEREKVEYLQKQVKLTEDDLVYRIAQMRQQIENDFKEIVGSVTALCQELKLALFKQIDQYESEQKETTDRFNAEINKNLKYITIEGQHIEKDFKQFLTNNFDYNNIFQVNEFMKKVREKENKFQAQQFILEQLDSLEEFKYDIKNNSYYKKRQVAFIKDSIYSVLQEALKNAVTIPQNQQNLNQTQQKNQNDQEQELKLLDFTRLKLQGQHLVNYKKQMLQELHKENNEKQGVDDVIEECVDQEKLEEWSGGYDKKSIVMEIQKDLKDAKADSSMISLQNKAIMQTDHKLAINSVTAINHNSFATCANEHKIKIWGFTHNYVIHLKATIELGDLAVQIQYHKQSNCLYVATSRGVIQVYSLPEDVSTAVDLNPKLIKEYVGHERTVRNISFLPNNFNQLISLSYDKTIKVWNIHNDVEQENALMYSIDLPNDEDCKFIETNEQYTIVGTVSGNILIYQNVLVDLNVYNTNLSSIKSRKTERSAAFGGIMKKQPKYQVQELKFMTKLRCSKEKISSIVLGSKNPHLGIVGSGNGTITILDLQKLQSAQLQESPNHNNNNNLNNASQRSEPNEEEDNNNMKLSFNNKGQILNPEVCIAFKFRHIQKQRICSLNLFEDNYLLAMSWDGLANLYDLKKQKVISTTRYTLQNDEKKHSDGASAKISLYDSNKYHVIAIGNNDKQIQVFSLQLKKSE